MTELNPCGHPATVAGCGGCDPGAIDMVICDDGTRRPYDPALDLTPEMLDRLWPEVADPRDDWETEGRASSRGLGVAMLLVVAAALLWLVLLALKIAGVW